MEIISKVSKGTKMDQIYLPKHRVGLNPGSFVIVKEIEAQKQSLFYYNVYIEKWKIIIINEIIKILNKYSFKNILFVGSFLEKENFNDIDILLINSKTINIDNIKTEIKNSLGINVHLISIDYPSLLKGISQDPLFQTMVSSYISKKRLIYNIKPEMNYKLLDLNLLKSEPFIKNFDSLAGNEKYYLIKNLIAINLFINKKKLITKQDLNKAITTYFGESNIKNLKDNILQKSDILKNYQKLYKKTKDKILRGINGSK